MNTIGVAIVGLGYWGPNILRNFYNTSGAEILYGCDLDLQKIEKQQKLFPSLEFTQDYTKVLQDDRVKLVCIATKASTHFSLAQQAIEAGKHVFIEKPMTSSAAEASQLNQLAQQMGVRIFVDHTFVFSSSVQKIQEYIAANEIGDMLYFDSTRINLGIIQEDTNVFWDLAVHDLSILSVLRNLSQVAKIYATGTMHFGKQIENGHIHIEFNDGFTAHIHVSWLSPVKKRQTIIAGTKAMITYDDTEPSEKIRLYDKGVDLPEAVIKNSIIPTYRSGDILIPKMNNEETLLVCAKNVIDTLQNTTKAMVDGYDGENLVKVLEAVDESIATQSIITL